MVEVEYGKSMFGGYYANFFYCGVHSGVHAKTIKELVKKLNSFIGADAWEFTKRYDN